MTFECWDAFLLLVNTLGNFSLFIFCWSVSVDVTSGGFLSISFEVEVSGSLLDSHLPLRTVDKNKIKNSFFTLFSDCTCEYLLLHFVTRCNCAP